MLNICNLVNLYFLPNAICISEKGKLADYSLYRNTCNLSRLRDRGSATGELGENSPPTSHKDHFCKFSKSEEKILGVWWGVKSPTILDFQPEFD